MQCLCLNNDKRDEAMNSHFTNTADSGVAGAFNNCSPDMDFLPFFTFG
jgi:hypothetical protein